MSIYYLALVSQVSHRIWLGFSSYTSLGYAGAHRGADSSVGARSYLRGY